MLKYAIFQYPRWQPPFWEKKQVHTLYQVHTVSPEYALVSTKFGVYTYAVIVHHSWCALAKFTMLATAILNFRKKVISRHSFKILRKNFAGQLRWPFWKFSNVEIRHLTKFKIFKCNSWLRCHLLVRHSFLFGRMSNVGNNLTVYILGGDRRSHSI